MQSGAAQCARGAHNVSGMRNQNAFNFNPCNTDIPRTRIVASCVYDQYFLAPRMSFSCAMVLGLASIGQLRSEGEGFFE